MLDATLRIVKNPGANVAALFTQSTSQAAAFSPALTTAPSDWTLYVTFTGGGMDYPSGIGVDANGNVWVGSYFLAGSTDPSAGSAAELSPIGKHRLFPSGISGFRRLSNIYGLAIDTSNNVWITNEASPGSVNGGLRQHDRPQHPSGQALSGTTGYTCRRPQLPQSPSPASTPTPPPGSSTTATPTSPISPTPAHRSPAPPASPRPTSSFPPPSPSTPPTTSGSPIRRAPPSPKSLPPAPSWPTPVAVTERPALPSISTETSGSQITSETASASSPTPAPSSPAATPPTAPSAALRPPPSTAQATSG